MACCVLILRLLAVLRLRLGLGPERARFSVTAPLVPLAVIGAAEIALAFGIARAWGRFPPAADHSMQAAMMPAGTLHRGVTPVVTLACVYLVLRLTGRDRTRSGFLALLLVMVAAVVSTEPHVTGSHLGLMAILETVLIVAPQAAFGGPWNREPGDAPFAGIRVLVVGGLAACVSAVFVVTHTPAGPASLMDLRGLPWWAVPSGWLLGAAFWASVTRLRLSSGLRLLVVGVVLETMMTVGLTMLVAAEPLTGTAPGGWILDQRLAGALTLVLDVAVLARLRAHGLSVRANHNAFRRGMDYVADQPAGVLGGIVGRSGHRRGRRTPTPGRRAGTAGAKRPGRRWRP